MQDSLSSVIRVRIEPEKKSALTRLYEQRGTTLSREIRSFLDGELANVRDPLARFDSIMASTDAKLDAYGAPEPTIEDIVSFVDAAREQRAPRAAVAQS